MSKKFQLNLWPLAFIFRTDKFISEKFSGKSFGPFVFVRPESSKHLLAHELTHVKQFYRTLGLLPILYQFDRFKLKFEIECYRAQYESGAEPKGLARALSEKYDLKISYEDALREITKGS